MSYSIVPKYLTLTAALLVSCAGTFSAYAQDNASSLLPGGASSLSETHGDWAVQCRLQAANDVKTKPHCSVSQQQQDNKGSRVLAVELQPTADGTSGALVLPFGLQLSKGVALQIDEAKPGASQQFSTCLPAGCIVPLNFGDAQLKALNAGKTLNLIAEAVNGGEVKLSISLDGFSAALIRVKELLK
ncbi:invasion associated locus B family protein [Paenochrobactrum pullorum]|uniref:invasion associated locus B family protein n=1 Tax=Paenochrobactrum pullorum TaxID=1324351 RepID=UPI0035BBAA51